jgi:hypothetical protein
MAAAAVPVAGRSDIDAMPEIPRRAQRNPIIAEHPPP